jgi:hypothetical protein
MRHIYNHALKTIVWIGEQDNNSLAMMYAKEIAKRHQEHVIGESVGMPASLTGRDVKKAAVPHEAALKLTAAWLVEQILDDDVSLLPVQALLEIFEVSWWQRCWVVQELVTSSSPTVVWGKANDTWFIFKTVPHVLQIACKLLHLEIRRQNPAVKPAHVRFAANMYNQNANNMRILRAVWKFTGGTELRHALTIARELNSTDARDRVFSFLGLLQRDYGITPDYRPSMTSERVFHEAVVKNIQVDSNLNILCDREPRSSSTDTKGPSWVPDFSRPLARRGFVDWHFQQDFRASGDLGPQFELRPSDGEPNRILRVGAIVLKPEIGASDFNMTDHIELLQSMIAASFGESGESGSDKFNGPGLELLHTLLFGVEYDALLLFFVELISKVSGSNASELSANEQEEEGEEEVDVEDGEETVETKSGSLKTEGAVETRDDGGNTDDAATKLDEIEKKLAIEDTYCRFHEASPGPEAAWQLLTTDKFHALVPRETQVGDRICVVLGVGAPLVLRPVAGGESEGSADVESFRLIGPAYVNGYMHGRVAQEYGDDKLGATWIDIV